MSSLISSVGTGGSPLTGVKRPTPGNPTHVPGGLPAFRGVNINPGGAVKAPKISGGNKPNQLSNVCIPINRVVPLEFLSGWVGRASPGDAIFVNKYPPGYVRSMSSMASNGLATFNATNGTQSVARCIGVDGLNRLLHGESQVSGGWIVGHNVLKIDAADGVKCAADVVLDGPRDTNVAPLFESGLSQSGLTLNDELRRFRLRTLDEFSLDGVVMSNDSQYSFLSNGSRDATIFNIAIQGPTPLNNGYLQYDDLPNNSLHMTGRVSGRGIPNADTMRTVETFSRGSLEGQHHIGAASPGVAGATGSKAWMVDGMNDFVASFAGTYTTFPTQMFDRRPLALDTLFVGLRAYEMNASQLLKLKTEAGGDEIAGQLRTDLEALVQAKVDAATAAANAPPGGYSYSRPPPAAYNYVELAERDMKTAIDQSVDKTTEHSLDYYLFGRLFSGSTWPTYYFFQYLPMSGRKAHQCQVLHEHNLAESEAPGSARAVKAAADAKAHALAPVDTQAQSAARGAKKYPFDEDVFDAVRTPDLLMMVGAWNVGRVLDTRAMKYNTYDGGPVDGASAVKIDVQIKWISTRDLPGGSADYDEMMKNRMVVNCNSYGNWQDPNGDYADHQDPQVPPGVVENGMGRVARTAWQNYLTTQQGVAVARYKRRIDLANAASPSMSTKFSSEQTDSANSVVGYLARREPGAGAVDMYDGLDGPPPQPGQLQPGNVGGGGGGGGPPQRPAEAWELPLGGERGNEPVLPPGTTPATLPPPRPAPLPGGQPPPRAGGGPPGLGGAGYAPLTPDDSFNISFFPAPGDEPDPVPDENGKAASPLQTITELTEAWNLLQQIVLDPRSLLTDDDRRAFAFDVGKYNKDLEATMKSQNPLAINLAVPGAPQRDLFPRADPGGRRNWIGISGYDPAKAENWNPDADNASALFKQLTADWRLESVSVDLLLNLCTTVYQLLEGTDQSSARRNDLLREVVRESPFGDKVVRFMRLLKLVPANTGEGNVYREKAKQLLKTVDAVYGRFGEKISGTAVAAFVNDGFITRREFAVFFYRQQFTSWEDFKTWAGAEKQSRLLGGKRAITAGLLREYWDLFAPLADARTMPQSQPQRTPAQLAAQARSAPMVAQAMSALATGAPAAAATAASAAPAPAPARGKSPAKRGKSPAKAKPTATTTAAAASSEGVAGAAAAPAARRREQPQSSMVSSVFDAIGLGGLASTDPVDPVSPTPSHGSGSDTSGGPKGYQKRPR